MNYKRRGNSISLYRSSWVPKGPQVSHGHTRQRFVGSLQADATEISPELASQLTQDECEALKSRPQSTGASCLSPGCAARSCVPSGAQVRC